MAVLLYCYGSLVRGLYFTNTVCQEIDTERRAEKRKLVITFISVTVVFFLGYTLTAVSYAFITTEEETLKLTFYDQFTSVADFVFVCSLCFNPIIYVFRSTSFRRAQTHDFMLQFMLTPWHSAEMILSSIVCHVCLFVCLFFQWTERIVIWSKTGQCKSSISASK